MVNNVDEFRIEKNRDYDMEDNTEGSIFNKWQNGLFLVNSYTFPERSSLWREAYCEAPLTPYFQ